MTIPETAAAAFLTEIRAVMHLDVPLLAVSPLTREADRRRMIDLGLSEVLSPTCKPDEVLETIRRARIAARTARPA